MRLYHVKGKEIPLATINELSKISGLTSKTLRKWEKQGLLPRPAVIEEMYSPIIGRCERRLYSEAQVRLFLAWVERVRPGPGIRIKKADIALLQDRWTEVTQIFYEKYNL